jgi:hypothetical protein
MDLITITKSPDIILWIFSHKIGHIRWRDNTLKIGIITPLKKVKIITIISPLIQIVRMVLGTIVTMKNT